MKGEKVYFNSNSIQKNYSYLQSFIMSQKQETFESGIKKLETIIESLEDDNLTLDKALVNFEKGIKLMRVCESHLRNAEGKLKELLKSEDGEFVEKVLGVTLDSVIGGEDFDE